MRVFAQMRSPVWPLSHALQATVQKDAEGAAVGTGHAVATSTATAQRQAPIPLRPMIFVRWREFHNLSLPNLTI
jgi:hypothetical protein